MCEDLSFSEKMALAVKEGWAITFSKGMVPDAETAVVPDVECFAKKITKEERHTLLESSDTPEKAFDKILTVIARVKRAQVMSGVSGIIIPPAQE